MRWMKSIVFLYSRKVTSWYYHYLGYVKLKERIQEANRDYKTSRE
jgi:hypothetical protein